MLDAICRSGGMSAEALNTLHACRPGHPLGKGRSRRDLFADAAFVLSGRRSISSKHMDWLHKQAETPTA